MNTQTHTPGPWILEQDTVFIGETRKVQPVLYHRDSEGMANARLIAAAPDLLHALELLYDTGSDSETINYARSIASKAIAKAKGREK